MNNTSSSSWETGGFFFLLIVTDSLVEGSLVVSAWGVQSTRRQVTEGPLQPQSGREWGCERQSEFEGSNTWNVCPTGRSWSSPAG